MESAKKGKALLVFFLLIGLVSHEVVTPVMCRSLEKFAEQKNYYSPTDPHTPSRSPRHSHKSTPPCDTPPHGGTPTLPSPGGGGYYNPPSAPAVVIPPSTPLVPVTPTPLVPIVPPTPFTPVISTPPAPPFIPDPNFPPFFPGTCDFWRTHPGAIWTIFGYCTIGPLFGLPATSMFGRDLSLPEALTNARTDGIGALLREGTASLLNSMVNKSFPFTTQQVKDAVAAAATSNKAAAAQAQLFKKANEGHLMHN